MEEVREHLTLPDPTPSAFDEIRNQREAIIEDREADFPIPGYDNKLIARYQRLGWDVIAKVRRKSMRQLRKDPDAEPDVDASCDLLAKACVGLFQRKDGKLVPLGEADPSLGDEPVTYATAGLPEALGIQGVTTARQAIRAIFVDEQPIILHAMEVQAWMGRAEEEGAEDF